MRNPKILKSAIGIAVAASFAVFCLAAFAADSILTERPAPVDAEQYADFMAGEALDVQDLAEGAEIQRRMFNRITPPGISWLQPMFPSVVPFDAANFAESFLDDLLGEDKNSVAIYPLSLALDPKTRETLVYNADGKLIATIPPDKASRVWPEDADPARVTLQLDLLPSEDVELYLYAESRIAESISTFSKSKPGRTGGIALRSLGSAEFGISDIRRLSNGTMQVTVSNGTDVAELFSYTVLHTSTMVVTTWTNEEQVVITDTNTLWYPASPSFNGIESEWACGTTNLVLTNGIAVWEDSGISTNDRVRFYAAAKRADADVDGLTDGTETFLYRTDPGNPDTDGDGWSDAEELAEETDPLDRFSATKLARGVVLNEVLYDASGTDLGKEWIELYSAGRYPVDVGGFVVQVADTAFSNAYVFPSNTWIDPGRFLLLGGSLVTNRDLEVDFTMPNRFTNDATAAVRLAAEVGTNTFVADCLMYGGNAANFNPNGLDTTGWISTNARSAGAGNSLIRLFTGHDTDQVLDWKWQSAPVPGSSDDIPDSDGDGLTDQEELTGSQNPYGEPTDRHNADSDGDGLSDFYECLTSETNPNTWATDGDIFPWPPPSGAVSNWWGSDSYELANGWNPQVFDENTNGIPDSWEMAFPGTNLYADSDNDTVTNLFEILQNSNPFDSNCFVAQPYVLRYESSCGQWENNQLQDVGLNGWVKAWYEGVNTNVFVCMRIAEGSNQEPYEVTWNNAADSSVTWLDSQISLASANLAPGTSPSLLVQDKGQCPNFTNTLGGEYVLTPVRVNIVLTNQYPEAQFFSIYDDTPGKKWVIATFPEPNQININWDVQLIGMTNASANIKYQRGISAEENVLWSTTQGALFFTNNWLNASIRLNDGTNTVPHMSLESNLLTITSVQQGDRIIVEEPVSGCFDQVAVVKNFSWNDLQRLGVENLEMANEFNGLNNSLKDAILSSVVFCLNPSVTREQRTQLTNDFFPDSGLSAIVYTNFHATHPNLLQLDIPSSRSIGIYPWDYDHWHIGLEAVSPPENIITKQSTLEQAATNSWVSFPAFQANTANKLVDLLNTTYEDECLSFILSHTYEYGEGKDSKYVDPAGINELMPGDPIRNIRWNLTSNSWACLSYPGQEESAEWQHGEAMPPVEVWQVEMFINQYGKVVLIGSHYGLLGQAGMISDALREE